ncbi:hypothetical protein BJY52DRAFT_1225971 [Lactarius psammicola]|nr:hypothetical protein BJY52DRAFT_1225971 [Lactarius psammicola]
MFKAYRMARDQQGNTRQLQNKRTPPHLLLRDRIVVHNHVPPLLASTPCATASLATRCCHPVIDPQVPVALGDQRERSSVHLFKLCTTRLAGYSEATSAARVAKSPHFDVSPALGLRGETPSLGIPLLVVVVIPNSEKKKSSEISQKENTRFSIKGLLHPVQCLWYPVAELRGGSTLPREFPESIPSALAPFTGSCHPCEQQSRALTTEPVLAEAGC